MKRLLGSILAAAVCSASAEWFPPENPDPAKILKEADADAESANHEDALSKYIWLFEDGVKYKKGFKIVREHALSRWHSLAQSYPPAMTSLRDVRDSTASAIRATERGGKAGPLMRDVAAIDKLLGDSKHTAALFAHLAEADPEEAKSAFPSARNALIVQEQYVLAARFHEPVRLLQGLRMGFNTPPSAARNDRIARAQLRFYMYEAGTAVALLAKADRKQEAEELAAKINEVWPTPEMATAIEKALGGEFPPAWP
jgi:hypothetical protein